MNSKLGVHFQTPPEDGAEGTEIIKASKIEWVKGIDPDAWANNPFAGKQRVLARLWIGGDDVEAYYTRRGADGAHEYFELVKQRYAKLRTMGIYDVAFANEPYVHDVTVDALEAFELEASRLAVSVGMCPWVWSIGVGHPDIGLAARMTGSIAYASANGGGFEIHEYAAPSVLSGDGWWTLRIKRTLAELYAAGLAEGSVRVFVGECGIDGGVIPWGQPEWASKKVRRGWKQWSGWAYTGTDCMGLSDPHDMTAELYWLQMSWLDDQYGQIPEVVAATPFVTNPNGDWKDFDWDGDMIQRTAVKHAWDEEEPVSLEQAIGDALQAVIVPLNETAALASAGLARGLIPSSDELDVPHDGTIYRCQAFRTPEDPARQHIAYCIVGDWSHLVWFEREN